jgi:hypothetical protein
MKKVKCFVLSLLLCFSFGCGPTQEISKSNLEILLKNMSNVEDYQCVRITANNNFLCTVIVNDEFKLFECGFDGCIIKQCPSNKAYNHCFQSNDTE